jgi:hypothetical protein
MKIGLSFKRVLTGVLSFLMMAAAQADVPLWTFTPDANFPPQVAIGSASKTTVKYTVTNFSPFSKNLILATQPGVTQVGECRVGPKNSPNASCQLNLLITGSEVPVQGISGGPVLCHDLNPSQCYGPNNIKQTLKISRLQQHTVNGIIFGLGGEITLLNNGTDPIVTNTDGTFTFSTALFDGNPYDVTIGQQPPNLQTCAVSNPTGIIAGADVTNISVACNINVLALDVNFTAPPGNTTPVILTTNTSIPSLEAITSGTYSFATLPIGAIYNLQAIPTSPNLVCAVSNNGMGVIGDGQVPNVTCAPIGFSIRGEVTGLSDTLTLDLDGKSLEVDSPSFAFPDVPAGASYKVTVKSNPPGQACTVKNSKGTVNAEVNNMEVSCVQQQADSSASIFVTETAIRIPVSTGGVETSSVEVFNRGPGIAFNVSATLPPVWVFQGVTQNADSCKTLFPNQTCELVFSSAKPFVPSKNFLFSIPIQVTGINVANPTPVAVGFTLNSYLIWQWTLQGTGNLATVNVVDNVDLPELVQWGNPSTPTLDGTGAGFPSDGATNTTIIANTPNIGPNAAANCLNSTNGGVSPGTWYLPAVFQMIFPNDNQANINSNLVKKGFDVGLANGQPLFPPGPLTMGHWSSTEYGIVEGGFCDVFPPSPNYTLPGICAWSVFYQANGNSFFLSFGKQLTTQLPPYTFLTRCVQSIPFTIP